MFKKLFKVIMEGKFTIKYSNVYGGYTLYYERLPLLVFSTLEEAQEILNYHIHKTKGENYVTSK